MQQHTLFQTIRADVTCIRQRDPAARHLWEVLTCYPGLHALILYRIAHRLWKWRLCWLARFLSYWTRALTGVDIHPAAQIGQGVFLDHAMGIVIGETAEIGDGCTIYQGVTLGGTSLYRGVKRHPTLGKNVIVGAGAKILGGFEVGNGAKIGSNAVVTKPVAADQTMVGVPASSVANVSGLESQGDVLARACETRGEASVCEPLFSAYGVTPTDDPVGQTLQKLIETCQKQQAQIAQLQAQMASLENAEKPAPNVA
jgi:serine O-acetyltransferase